MSISYRTVLLILILFLIHPLVGGAAAPKITLVAVLPEGPWIATAMLTTGNGQVALIADHRTGSAELIQLREEVAVVTVLPQDPRTTTAMLTDENDRVALISGYRAGLSAPPRAPQATVGSPNDLEIGPRIESTLPSESADLTRLREEVTRYRQEVESLRREIAQLLNVTEPSVIRKIYTEYTVLSGDTISHIGSAFGINYRKIMEANSLESSTIYPGQRLVIPERYPLIAKQPGGRTERLLWPIAPDGVDLNLISAFYGEERDGYINTGLDIEFAGQVVAARDGRVVFIGEKQGYGGMVVVHHDDGFSTRYALLQRTEVTEGAYVRAGDPLGFAPRLRFELLHNDEPVNPIKFLLEPLGTFRMTMYTEWDDILDTNDSFRITASGTTVKHLHTAAADLDLFNFGDEIYIPYFRDERNHGVFVIEDTGSAIQGKAIDIYVRDRSQASAFTPQYVEIYLIRRTRSQS
ncbi:MAG: peptidoglycan DD-metalloendopeptidase family protein [Candidatus Bipolaricaulia bacterium]